MGKPNEGFRVAVGELAGGRIGIGSLALGIGLAAMDYPTRYAVERRQFGQPIASFQAIQWMIAESYTKWVFRECHGHGQKEIVRCKNLHLSGTTIRRHNMFENVDEIRRTRKQYNQKMFQSGVRTFREMEQLEAQAFQSGNLAQKYKELIALGISIARGCYG